MEIVPPRIVDPIPITLDKPRTLLFHKEAVKACERSLAAVYGDECTFYSVLLQFNRLVSEADLRCLHYGKLSLLVWRGVQHEDPHVTLDQIESAMPPMDFVRLVEIAATVLQAWQAGSPPLPAATLGEEAPETDPLAGSPGTPSGVLSAASLA